MMATSSLFLFSVSRLIKVRSNMQSLFHIKSNMQYTWCVSITAVRVMDGTVVPGG